MRLTGLGFGVLARLRAERRLVAGVAIVAFMAVVLLAAAPVFGSAVVRASLQNRVADAPINDGGVIVSGRVDGSDIVGVDESVRLRLGEVGVLDEAWSLMRSDSFTAPIETIGDRRVVATIGWWHGPVESLGMVEGSMPEDAGGTGTALHAEAAGLLGVGVGDDVVLHRADTELRLTVVGIFDPVEDERLEPFGRLSQGVASDASFIEVGPLLVTADVFAAGGTRATGVWVAALDSARVEGDELGEVAGAVGGIKRALPDLEVRSGLPRLLATARTAVDAASSTIDALLVSMAVLALIALAFTVLTVVDERRLEIEMVRARGADVLEVAWSSAAEGLLLAVVAVGFGPLVAVGIVAALGSAVGSLGGALQPRLSSGAWIAAAVGGLAAVVVLTAPAASTAGSFASARAGRSRFGRHGIVHRLGLDVVVFVAAAVALWRILGRDSDAVGADPLVTVAPGLTWLMGMVLLARIAPVVFGAFERGTQRADPSVALAVASTARRPNTSNRMVLLVASAAAILGFALSFGASWRASQLDQASLEVGSGLTVQPDLETWQVAGSRDDVGAAFGRTVRTGSTQVSVALVALDATVASVRDDLKSDLNAWAGLGSGVRLGIPLGGSVVEADADLIVVGDDVSDDPLRVSMMVQDRYGRVIQSSRALIAPGSSGRVRFDLGTTGPFELVGVALGMTAPAQLDPSEAATARFLLDLDGLSSDGGAVPLAGETFDVDQTTSGFQDASMGVVVDDGSLELSSTVVSTGPSAPVTTRLILHRDELPTLRAFATPAFYAEGGLGLGDEILLPVGAVSPLVELTGTIDAVPTRPQAEQALVVDYADLQTWAWFAAGDTLTPDLLMAGEDDDGLLAAAGRSPVTVTRRASERAADPVSVGVLGSLTFGGAAVAMVVAIGVGFAIVAAARARVFEFALLQAMGMTSKAIRTVFVGEHVVTASVGALTGSIIGLILAAIAVPSMTVDSEGRVVVPEPRLEAPWLLLAVVSIVAVASVWALSRAAFRISGHESPGSVIREGEER